MKNLEYIQSHLYYKCGFDTHIKAAYVANLFKGSIFFYLVTLMIIYNNYSMRCIIYLVLHGSYGFLWVMKYFVFPDKYFEQSMGIVSLLGGCGLLMLYMVAPTQMIIQQREEIREVEIVVSFLVYILGVNLMMISDCQKYFMHQVNRQQLIQNGLFKYNRNPNYLGEMMIYFSFSYVAQSGYGILIMIWVVIFIPNLLVKELRLSRRKGFKEYRKNSNIILFKFW